MLYEKYVKETIDADGKLSAIKFNIPEDFNFGFDIVDKHAEDMPDKLAMIWCNVDGVEKRFTFKDISVYSNKVANYFTRCGIKRGDKVMLILKRHFEFWFSIVALHKIGAVVIPATHLLVEHDLTYRFNAAHVSAVVCTSDGELAGEIEKAEKNSHNLNVKIITHQKRDGWHFFDDAYDCEDTFVPEVRNSKDDTMLMYFTSGTTGNPKIAAHSYTYPLGHFITAKWWHNVDTGADGLHFTVSDTGWGKAVWGKLYGQWIMGATVLTYDFDKFNPNDMLTIMEKYRITTFCAPPTIYRFFIKEDLSKYNLSSLKYATIAGEALNPEVFKQFKQATGISLMEGFGQTETTMTIGNLLGMEPRPGSMGKPSPMYHVRLVDYNGNDVATGEVGEVIIKDDCQCGLFKGYYELPEQTKEVWHDGYYHTGDTAWKDEEGYFWYEGRVDDLIKSSGYRIGPFEIESILMEHPSVLECAVTGVPDPIRGQVVKATVVLTKNALPTEQLKKQLQNYVKEHTAPYKYPRIVEFVDELPKTISGKIKRAELRKADMNK